MHVGTCSHYDEGREVECHGSEDMWAARLACRCMVWTHPVVDVARPVRRGQHRRHVLGDGQHNGGVQGLVLLLQGLQNDVGQLNVHVPAGAHASKHAHMDA